MIVDEFKKYSAETKELLRKSQHATYLTYLKRFGISEEYIYCLLDHDIQSLIDSEDSISLIATANDRLSGILVGSFLKWDTAHFGFPCYKINYLFSNGENNPEKDVSVKKALLRAFKENVHRKKARFIMGRVVGDDWGSLWALEGEGSNMVDTLLVLAKDITEPSVTRVDLPTRVTKGCPPDLLPKLEAILMGALPGSRFMVDFRFPHDSGEEVYLKWLEGVCQKSAENSQGYIPVHSEEGHKGEQEKLLVLEKGESEVVGFITYKSQQALGIGSIELIVTNPLYRGMKAGEHLIGLVEDELRSEGIHILEVTAYLHNQPAINAYIRSSFSLVSSIYTFHLWL